MLNIRGQGYLANSGSTSDSVGDIQDSAQLLGDRVPRPAVHADLGRWIPCTSAIASPHIGSFPGVAGAVLSRLPVLF